jgi:peptidoglycan hydrolase-like protein with peptidoglycan-binding domain
LVLDPDTERETVFSLALGALHPLTETSGVRQRLANIGYVADAGSDRYSPRDGAAIRRFQQDQQLPPSGRPDSQTTERLRTVHEC